VREGAPKTEAVCYDVEVIRGESQEGCGLLPQLTGYQQFFNKKFTASKE